MRRKFAFILVILGISSFVTQAVADRRVALVIGNASYQNAARLANPTNDATDVAASLKRLGFTVSTVIDANFEAMRRALGNFTRQARGAEMAVIFFAGHGLEIAGENWLVPVDADLASDTDVETQAINLKTLMLAVSNTTSAGVVILDACRNNPLANKMQRTNRTRAVQRGLARVEPSNNILVAYAAKDGTTASDGSGRNSPFSKALLQHIEIAGLEIAQLFRSVRDDVMSATNGEQQPNIYHSLSKQLVYFKRPLPGDLPSAEDQVRWRMLKEAVASAEFDDLVSPPIKRAAEARAIEQFLREFPNGSNIPEARARLAELKLLLAANPPTEVVAEDEVSWRTLGEIASGKLFSELSPSRRREAEARGIEEFLRKFPRGRRAAEAQLRLAELKEQLAKDPPANSEEELAWRTLRELAEGTLFAKMSTQQRLVIEASGIEEFLKRFPQSRNAGTARSRLAHLERLMSERLAASTVDSNASEDKRFVATLRARTAQSLTTAERGRLAEIAGRRSGLELEIPFEYNSAEVGSKAVPVLLALGRVLSKDEFKGNVFLIIGHTDGKGGLEYNQDLSARRAEAVKALFVKQFNLPPTSLIAIGYGKTQPKNAADPFAGENRRVQIVNTEVK